MSPKSTSKLNKPIFQSYFWPAFMALFMAVVLSQWAVADPPEGKEETGSMEQITTPPDPSPPLEIPAPEASEIDSEGTPDDLDGVQDDTENKNYMTPVFDPIPLAEKCYEQKDGSFECVCEGDHECETLKTAEHCEPGTHWGKNGFGGCTKKSADK